MNYVLSPEFLFSRQENGDILVVSLDDSVDRVIRISGALATIFQELVEENKDLESIEQNIQIDDQPDLHRFIQMMEGEGILTKSP